MKLLFISNFTGKKVGSFSIASIMAAKSLGYEYHLAANFRNSTSEQMMRDEEYYGIHLHQIDFERNPFDLKNLRALRQVIKLIRREKIDMIHCNTPIGGAAGRIAGWICKVPVVIYQVHGFHFYKGAPLINWVLFYSIERWLAKITDVLITINKEDYDLANTFSLRNRGKVYYVPGVGIDTNLYISRETIRSKKRASLMLKDDDIMAVSIGNTGEKEKYITAISSIAKVNNKNIHYYICGEDLLREELKKHAFENGLEHRIHFLDFESVNTELYLAADVFLSINYEDGLIFLLRAMASGLPYIALNTKRETNPSINRISYQNNSNDEKRVVNELATLATDSRLRKKTGYNNIITIMNGYFTLQNNVQSTDNSRFLQSHLDEDIFEYIPSRIKKRHEIGVPLDAFVIISVGELNENKNNIVVIEALRKMSNEDIHYIICGEGHLQKQLEKESLDMKDNIHFLGYRQDIRDLLMTSDVFVLPSYREGLSRSLMEAMCMGLPCVVSDIRGNRDLIDKEMCFQPDDSNRLKDIFNQLYVNQGLREKIGKDNNVNVKNLDIRKIVDNLKEIYDASTHMGGK